MNIEIVSSLLALVRTLTYEDAQVIDRALVAAFDMGKAEVKGAGLTLGTVKGVVNALAHGEKITAIKLYRNATGLELTQSKKDVEAIAASFGYCPTGYDGNGMRFSK